MLKHEAESAYARLGTDQNLLKLDLNNAKDIAATLHVQDGRVKVLAVRLLTAQVERVLVSMVLSSLFVRYSRGRRGTR